MSNHQNVKEYPFYYLKSCDTCQKILRSLPQEKLILINIKDNPLDEKALEQLKMKAGTYQALFNNRAQLLKTMPTDEKPETEDDYKRLLLSNYTFLKRPVAVIDGEIFIGNEETNVKTLREKLLKTEKMS